MDQTNTGVPGASNQIAGDVHRQAAIRRLKLLEQRNAQKNAMSPAPPTVAGVGQSAAPRGY